MSLKLVYFSAVLLMVLLYAFLSAFTNLLYRGKPITELSYNEIKILDGNASMVTRLVVFLGNFFTGFLFPPVHITAGVVTLVAWLIS